MNDSNNDKEKKKFIASLSDANSLSIRLCEKYTEENLMKPIFGLDLQTSKNNDSSDCNNYNLEVMGIRSNDDSEWPNYTYDVPPEIKDFLQITLLNTLKENNNNNTIRSLTIQGCGRIEGFYTQLFRTVFCASNDKDISLSILNWRDFCSSIKDWNAIKEMLSIKITSFHVEDNIIGDSKIVINNTNDNNTVTTTSSRALLYSLIYYMNGLQTLQLKTTMTEPPPPSSLFLFGDNKNAIVSWKEVFQKLISLSTTTTTFRELEWTILSSSKDDDDDGVILKNDIINDLCSIWGSSSSLRKLSLTFENSREFRCMNNKKALNQLLFNAKKGSYLPLEEFTLLSNSKTNNNTTTTKKKEACHYHHALSYIRPDDDDNNNDDDDINDDDDDDMMDDDDIMNNHDDHEDDIIANRQHNTKTNTDNSRDDKDRIIRNYIRCNPHLRCLRLTLDDHNYYSNDIFTSQIKSRTNSLHTLELYNLSSSFLNDETAMSIQEVLSSKQSVLKRLVLSMKKEKNNNNNRNIINNNTLLNRSFYHSIFVGLQQNNGTLESLQLLNCSISIREDEDIDDNNNELLPVGRALSDALISNTTLKELNLGCCRISIQSDSSSTTNGSNSSSSIVNALIQNQGIQKLSGMNFCFDSTTTKSQSDEILGKKTTTTINSDTTKSILVLWSNILQYNKNLLFVDCCRHYNNNTLQHQQQQSITANNNIQYYLKLNRMGRKHWIDPNLSPSLIPYVLATSLDINVLWYLLQTKTELFV